MGPEMFSILSAIVSILFTHSTFDWLDCGVHARFRCEVLYHRKSVVIDGLACVSLARSINMLH